MIYLIITVSIFFLSLLIHIFLCRLLKKSKIKTFKTLLIFPLGFMLLIINIFNLSRNQFNLTLPLTSVFLFILLSVAFFFLFFGPFIGDIGPTYLIIYLLEQKNALSFQEILRWFSDHELIINRLHFLAAYGYIKKTGQYYTILSKGKRLSNFIDFYRLVLGWYAGG